MSNTNGQLVDAARGVLRASGFFVDNLWHVDDVNFLCEQRNWPRLSEDEAKEVFLLFNALFDGETGLTWHKLEQATRTYLRENGRLAL